MKKLILILLFPLLGYSQNTVSTLVGYKSFEVNFKIKGDLNYGVAVSMTDAKEVAKRATRMDHPNKHIANDKLASSLFFLIGATFEDITITGKLGATYFEQSINSKKEAQNIYRSVGVQVQYKKFIFSYDSANSAMIGYEIKL
jgi:hypothetical protein